MRRQKPSCIAIAYHGKNLIFHGFLNGAAFCSGKIPDGKSEVKKSPRVSDKLNIARMFLKHPGDIVV